MNRPALALGVVLLLSLAANGVLLLRMRNPPEPTPVRNTPAPPLPPVAETPRASVDLSPMLIELAQLRQDVAALREELESKPGTDPLPRAHDPRVAALLGEQGKIESLFADLKLLSTTRDRIDRERYLQAVLDTTVDALGLAEPARTRFLAAAREAGTDMDRAWQDHVVARKAAPPEDPKNPDAQRAQRQALNKPFLDQLRACTDKVNASLDFNLPTHKQFKPRAESWVLIHIAPEGARHYDRRK